MKIRIMILEDNPILGLDIQETLEQNGMEVLAVYSSAEEGLDHIYELNPDILLVDIHLKGPLTGVDFAKSAKEFSIPIVFLTGTDKQDIISEAINVLPSSFISKPFREKDLVNAIVLAHQKKQRKTKAESLFRIQEPFVFVKLSGKFLRLDLRNILYLEADGSYSRIYTNQECYLLSNNLNGFITQLDELSKYFMRIHRSYLINIQAISSLDNDYVFIENTSLPIGRRYKSELKNRLKRIT